MTDPKLTPQDHFDMHMASICSEAQTVGKMLADNPEFAAEWQIQILALSALFLHVAAHPKAKEKPCKTMS